MTLKEGDHHKTQNLNLKFQTISMLKKYYNFELIRDWDEFGRLRVLFFAHWVNELTQSKVNECSATLKTLMQNFKKISPNSPVIKFLKKSLNLKFLK